MPHLFPAMWHRQGLFTVSAQAETYERSRSSAQPPSLLEEGGEGGQDVRQGFPPLLASARIWEQGRPEVCVPTRPYWPCHMQAVAGLSHHPSV